MKFNLARLREFGVHLESVNSSFFWLSNVYIEAPIYCASNIRWDTPISIGAFANLNAKSEIGHAALGRYVSVAQNCYIGSDKHPVDWLTSSRISYVDDFRGFASFLNKNSKRNSDFKRTGDKVIIGNDVLIANSCIINRGVVIGTGAIVAAGSVVTKDVPPYAIVGGNPAKVIKMRFSDDIVERLLLSRWWDYCIYDFSHLDLSNVLSFLDFIENDGGGLKKFNPPVIDRQSLMNFVEEVDV